MIKYFEKLVQGGLPGLVQPNPVQKSSEAQVSKLLSAVEQEATSTVTVEQLISAVEQEVTSAVTVEPNLTVSP